jgi:uncharacterized lipoprotein YddW (UPF0748 family)
MRLAFLSSLLFAVALTAGCATVPDPSSPETPVGFWVRLTGDAEADARMWDELAQARATDLFVETFYHGLMIYPNSNIAPQRPEWAGQDPLRWAIDEAHARGIRLHAWVECLYLAPDREAYPEIPHTPLLDRARENDWIVRALNGSQPKRVFLSPANPQVRDLVTRVCLDIAHRYPDVDGINLDYIRWPTPGELNIDGAREGWYDAANLSRFMAATGLDPREDRSPETLERLRRHSADQVTALVRMIHTALHGLHPSIKVSAAFFSDRDESAARPKAQDWRTWLAEGLLDVATPMCYAPSREGMLEEVQSVVETADEHGIPVWAGLSVHHGTDHPPAAEQLSALQGIGAEGVVFFSHGWIAEHPAEFLDIGAWFSDNAL